MTYIDFTTAFDSIYHSYLLEALKSYGVPMKYCRLVREIYKSAEIRVRLQDKGGNKSYSRNVSVSRGVIQGDIPSPVCFLVALDKILREHGGLDTGIRVTENLLLSNVELADVTASRRLTHLAEKSLERQACRSLTQKRKSSTYANGPECQRQQTRTLIICQQISNSSSNATNAQ